MGMQGLSDREFQILLAYWTIRRIGSIRSGMIGAGMGAGAGAVSSAIIALVRYFMGG